MHVFRLIPLEHSEEKPKIDILCNSITINNKTATIIGGARDGETIPNIVDIKCLGCISCIEKD